MFKQMQQCKRTTNTGMFSAFSTTAGVGLLNEVYEAPRYCCGRASQGGITIASTTDLGPFPAPGWGSNTLPPGPQRGGGGGGGGALQRHERTYLHMPGLYHCCKAVIKRYWVSCCAFCCLLHAQPGLYRLTAVGDTSRRRPASPALLSPRVH